MRIILRQETVVLTSLALILFTGSCKKEYKPDYEYFVSKEFKVSYSESEILNLLSFISAVYPEINTLKQSVVSDVDVFRVVYKTTINGVRINASGLACFPKNKGEYPILCFQNGTNTVKANAPSKNAGNPLYQMIEVVASLGYVVVIPDYPGFGESENIVHPYLIKEPTIQSIIDMLYSLKESTVYEMPGLTLKNEYYLIGYSQGGWATLNLHKALEISYPDDFRLRGSVCGAGPYDMQMLFSQMIGSQTYMMPVYLGYIAFAYHSYDQFLNRLSEIFNEPYDARIESLYNGTLTSAQINDQLSTSIPELIRAELISGFATSPNYRQIRDALEANSVTPWKTETPLLMIHGGADTSVSPLSTDVMYEGMIRAGTSEEVCHKEIIPDLDHGKGIIPCMIKGLVFLNEIRLVNKGDQSG